MIICVCFFARAGEQYCPDCQVKVSAYSVGEITEAVRRLARQSKEVLVFSPLSRQEKVEPKVLLTKVEQSGFEWARVNGELLKINELADYKFDRHKKYDAELLTGKIIDIKKQNPSAMVETAADLSNGLVIVSADGQDEVFSTSGLCPRCGKIMPTLDIRSFSFNSPYGACPRCTGLGITMEVDQGLVIPNPRLTLAEGAIQPWMRITGNQNWYQKILNAVAEQHNFSVNLPVMDLPAQNLDLILYGTGEETYEVDGKKTTFLGVIPDLMQRHLETSSDYVRREIEQYMREKVCPVCQGKRLRRESLAVRLGDYTIAEISGMSVEENKLTLKEKLIPSTRDKTQNSKLKIMEPIVKEIVQRLDNLDKVGLSYLSLDRSMNTLSGGEATRVRLASQLSTGLTGVIYILDEPSVGLHPRDNEKLIETLRYLRDLGQHGNCGGARRRHDESGRLFGGCGAGRRSFRR